MYLVDTHVLLWLVSAPERIGPRTRAALERADFVCVSAVSTLELVIKSMTGRLTVPEPLEQLLVEQGLRPLAFEARHAIALTEFPELTRHDPFDRALLGQALTEGLRFATADRVLLGLGLGWVVDATD